MLPKFSSILDGLHPNSKSLSPDSNSNSIGSSHTRSESEAESCRPVKGQWPSHLEPAASKSSTVVADDMTRTKLNTLITPLSPPPSCLNG